MVGFPNNHGVFPTKNDQHLGCEMGVPPFKETPIYRGGMFSKVGHPLYFSTLCLGYINFWLTGKHEMKHTQITLFRHQMVLFISRDSEHFGISFGVKSEVSSQSKRRRRTPFFPKSRFGGGCLILVKKELILKKTKLLWNSKS